MKRTTAVLALAVGVLAAPAAHAEQTSLGFNSGALDVAMTSDGAAHVAYLDGATLKVCRIAPGDAACAQTTAQALPNNNLVGVPTVLAVGNRVTALIPDGTGNGGQTFATTSASGAAASYGPLTKIADLQVQDASMSADGNRIFVVAERGSGNDAKDYLTVGSAPLPGGGPPTGGSVLSSASGGRSVGDFQIAPRPDGRPIALVSGVFPGDTREDRLYAFKPAPADPSEPTQINDQSQWVPPVSFTPPAGSEENGSNELAAGGGALWLGYQGLGVDVLLRKWNGTAFGAAVRPDCVAKRYGSGSQAAPALAVAANGDTLTAYVTGDGTNQHLGYVRGNGDGTSFSAYQELTTPVARIQDVEIAADPTGTGIVVWTDSASGVTPGTVRFTRLPATTFAACPVPPGTGGGGTTTPPPVTKPPVTTPPPARKPALSSVVSGLPSAKKCVSKRSFKIRLRNPKGTRIVRGTIKVNGKTKAVRKGKRVRARINLKGLPRGRYTVKITLKLADGRTLRYTRKYRTCTPGKRKRR